MKNKCLMCGERIPDCKCIKMNIEEAIGYLKNYKYDNEVREAIDTVLNELENSQKATTGIYDDYQDLGKEYYKLQCELEKKDKVIDLMAKEFYIEGYCKNIKCKKCEAKNFVECIKEYFYKKVRTKK